MTFDQALAQLSAAANRINALASDLEGAWWSIGDEVSRLEDSPVPTALGYDSAEVMFASVSVSVPYPTLARYARMRRATTEDEGRRFKAAPVAAFLEYERAAAGRHEPGSLADQAVEVPTSDGSATSKRFAECTQAEIELATRRKAGTERSAPVTPPPMPTAVPPRAPPAKAAASTGEPSRSDRPAPDAKGFAGAPKRRGTRAVVIAVAVLVLAGIAAWGVRLLVRDWGRSTVPPPVRAQSGRR